MRKRMNFISVGLDASNDLFGEHLYKLVDRNVRNLTRKFNTILSAQDIDDIVHDAWIYVFNRKDNYKADGKFEGWVYKTCRNFVWKLTPKVSKGLKVTLSYDNEANDEYFGLDSDYSSEFADCSMAPDTLMISDESEEHIWKGVGRLKEKEQKLVRMMIDEKAREEMSQEIGCSDGNLRVKILRVREKLKGYAIGA